MISGLQQLLQELDRLRRVDLGLIPPAAAVPPDDTTDAGVDIAFWPASELAGGLRRRAFGVRELVDMFIARIGKLDPLCRPSSPRPRRMHGGAPIGATETAWTD